MTDFLAACLGLFSRTCVALASLSIFNFFLCVLLFLSRVGTVGTVQGQPMDTAGMYGAILLHEGAGGYVLVAVAVFTLAVVITVICMRLHERERQKQKRERKDKEDAI